MGNKLNILLRKVFLGSLAGITASNNASAAKLKPFVSESTRNTELSESLFARKPDHSLKLLLKRSSSNELVLMSHRSHRSHSSHRSHYSSSSGSGTRGSSSTPKTNPGLQPNYSNQGTGSPTSGIKFGARTLKRGMSGTDVTELVNILLRKKYLKLDDGGTQVTGEYTYDEIIEDAVKRFQTDNGLTSDGICDSKTTYYLKNGK